MFSLLLLFSLEDFDLIFPSDFIFPSWSLRFIISPNRFDQFSIPSLDLRPFKKSTSLGYNLHIIKYIYFKCTVS